MYRRYDIHPQGAPHRYPVPNKFEVKTHKLNMALMLLGEAVHYGLDWVQYVFAERPSISDALRDLRHKLESLTDSPCIYGVFDGKPLRGFKPRSEMCVGCLRCVEEYPDVAKVSINPRYLEQGDANFDPDSVATLLEEAATGKIPVRGVGYQGEFAGEGFDAMWTDMSEIVRPTRDGIYGREYISTAVEVGRRPVHLDLARQAGSDGGSPTWNGQSVTIPVPMIFDAPPDHLRSGAVDRAIVGAAARLDTLCIVDPEACSGLLGEGLHSEKADSPLVVRLSSETLGKAQELAGKVRFLEYEYDGAHRHRTLKDGEDGPLVIVRLPFKPGFEEPLVELARDEKVDAVHLYANYHGREHGSEAPRHVFDLIRAAHTRLVAENVRDLTTLIVGGGITRAEHVPKAILLGADLVSLDVPLLVALQAQFSGECASPQACEMALRPIDAAWGAQRLVNLVAAWRNQLLEIISAMGIRDVRRNRGEMGRTLLHEELEREAFGDIDGFPAA